MATKSSNSGVKKNDLLSLTSIYLTFLSLFVVLWNGDDEDDDGDDKSVLRMMWELNKIAYVKQLACSMVAIIMENDHKMILNFFYGN